MTEYRLFPIGATPTVSTLDFHRDRPRARHLEEPAHRDRLTAAIDYVRDAYRRLRVAEPDRVVRLSDLGCGDGGLLSQVKWPGMSAWGYDFTPANAGGWPERRVVAYRLDAFGKDRDLVRYGDITVMTEVLEHLADPHGAVGRVTSRYLVASSPWNESTASHDECHAWAWDRDGYRDLLARGGFTIVHAQTVNQFQVVLGERA